MDNRHGAMNSASRVFGPTALAVGGFALFSYFHSTFMGWVNGSTVLLGSYWLAICGFYGLMANMRWARRVRVLAWRPGVVVGAYLLYGARALMALPLPEAVGIAVLVATGAAWAFLNFAWLDFFVAKVLSRSGEEDYPVTALACALCALWGTLILLTAGELPELLALLSWLGAAAAHGALLWRAKAAREEPRGVSDAGRGVGAAFAKGVLRRQWATLSVLFIFGTLYGLRQHNESLVSMFATGTLESMLGILVGAVLTGVLAFFLEGEKGLSRLFDLVPLLSALALLGFAFQLFGDAVGQFVFSLAHIVFFIFAYVFVMRMGRGGDWGAGSAGAAWGIGFSMLCYEGGIAVGVLVFGAAAHSPELLDGLVITAVLVLMAGTVLIARRPDSLEGGALLGAAAQPSRRPSSAAASDEEALAAMASRYYLSRRERDVLSYLVCGLTQKAIAEAMVLAPSTIKSHAKRLYEKTDVHSKDELIMLFQSFKG